MIGYDTTDCAAAVAPEEHNEDLDVKDNDKQDKDYDYHPDIGYFEVGEDGEPVDAEYCSAACAAAASPEDDDFSNVLGHKEELECAQSAACAVADSDDAPSLRKAVAKELKATAKAEDKDKANKGKATKDIV